MAIFDIANGEGGASVRAKLNAAIARANEVELARGGYSTIGNRITAVVDFLNAEQSARITADVAEASARAAGDASEAAARSAGDATEAAARVAGDTAEAAARIAGDAAEAVARETAVRLITVEIPSRPGDAPIAHASELTSGAPGAIGYLDDDVAIVGDNGTVVRVQGEAIVAPRRLYAAEPSRTYRVRYVVQRRTNSADPSNDTVRLAIAWYDRFKTRLSGGSAQTVVEDITNLTVASGRVQVTATASRSPEASADHIAPAGARYARPYVQTFGADGHRTDIEVIDWRDITDLMAWSPDVSDLDDRLVVVESLFESLDIADRLTAVETSIGDPFRKSYPTAADAEAEAVPASVNQIELLNYVDIGRGRASYKRVGSEPSHSGKIQTNDGAWWEISEFLLTPDMFGAAADGVTDDAAAIQATHDAAKALGVKWRLCPLHKVASTVTVSGGGLQGAVGGSVIIAGITNGSPVFDLVNEFVRLADVYIRPANFVTADYLAGTQAAQACTGIRTGVSGGASVSRLQIDNIHCRGLAIGWDSYGWILTGANVWMDYCDLGWRGNTPNSADLNLRFENCIKSFEITASSGAGAIRFRQLLDEGLHPAAEASTIDGCHSVAFDSPYWEQATAPRSVPFLRVGFVTECQQVKISAMKVALAADGGVVALAFDKVDGLEVTGRGGTNTFRTIISTTTNTKNFRLLDIYAASTPWLSDDSGNIGTAWNYFANRTFDAWFRGWANVVPTNATLAKETAIVRRGQNAVRITANSGAANNRIEWFIEGEPVVALRGKTIRLGAWVYVPAIAEYPNDTGRTKLPGILAQSYNGGTLTSSPTRNTLAVSGRWNYMWTDLTMQADATRIYAVIYANHSGTNANGNEYLIVGEMTLCETIVPLSRQMAGDVIDHPTLPKFFGGRMIAVGAAKPADADQVYEPGDQIIKPTQAASTSPGWMCIAAGAGGVGGNWVTLPALGT